LIYFSLFYEFTDLVGSEKKEIERKEKWKIHLKKVSAALSCYSSFFDSDHSGQLDPLLVEE